MDMTISKSILSALIFFLGACTVYKSSDRDTFNSNALAGAPTKTSVAEPLAHSCETVAAREWERETLQARVQEFRNSDGSHRILVRKDLTHGRIGQCEFMYSPTTDRLAAVQSSQEITERYFIEQ